MKSSLFFLFTVISIMATAQNRYVENSQLTANFLLPGLVFEQGISEKSTLSAEATMGFAYRSSDIFDDGFGIFPIGRLQYRYYYNFERRLQNGNTITGNSANYIAPTFGMQSGNAIVGDLDYDSNYFGGLGVVYGLQRTAPKGFNFRLEIGPAYYFDEFESGFGLMAALKLGWVIGKSKK